MDGSQTKYAFLNRVEAGDIIVNKIWARNGSVAVIPNALEGCYASGEFPLFRPTPGVLCPQWFHWLTKTKPFWHECDEKSRGTSGKNRIRPERFLEIPIPLPPLEEQRRIVARIEELATYTAEARELRRQVAGQRQLLLGSILSSLHREDWPTVPLHSLVAEGTTLSYGVLVPGPDVDDGVPFVRIQDLDRRNPPRRPAKRIAASVERQYARTRLIGGEVLLGVVGGIGKIGIVPASWAGANIARAVCRIQPKAEVDGEYLAYALASPQTQRFFTDATRTLAQPTLNISQLRVAPIPLPSLDAQRLVSAHIRRTEERIDGLTGLQADASAELNALLPSILDKAFKGEL